MKKYYKIIVYTENSPGVLSKITSVFRRRKINIESLSAFKYDDITHEIDVYLYLEESRMDHIIKQIEKKIDIFSAHSYEINSNV